MTVAVAWVRSIRDCQELIFVSDSRLHSGAKHIDCCAKIQLLPRSDCVIAFGGPTDEAFPLMHQLANAISAYGPARDRAMDLRELKSHALKVFNAMASAIKSPHPELLEQEAEFLLGGYSWIAREFFLWRIAYDKHLKEFHAYSAVQAQTNSRARKLFFGRSKRAGHTVNVPMGAIAFAGDQGPEARRRLVSLMKSRFDSRDDDLANAKLDMEPFEVVRDMLRSPGRAHTIGGPPQFVKVYQHMNSAPLAIYWPAREDGEAYLLGRPLLPYERIDHWYLDPDQLTSSSPQFTRLATPVPPQSAEDPTEAPDPREITGSR